MTALSDWSRAKVGDPAPCVLCGRDAWLRHPETGRPCHKTCDDQQRGVVVPGRFPSPGCLCRYCTNGLPVPMYVDDH